MGRIQHRLFTLIGHGLIALMVVACAGTERERGLAITPAQDGEPVPVAAIPEPANDGQISFESISLDEGLSQSVVMDILQDRQGFMWFATQDGLNRYDGRRFVVFKQDRQDPNSLNDNLIQALYEDPQGILWVGTHAGGLNRYDPATERFSHIRQQTDNSEGLSHNNVLALAGDPAGTLWVGTGGGGGLDRYDPDTGTISHYRQDLNDSDSLSGTIVQSLLVDRHGKLWIGTLDGGLNRLDPETGRFTHYRFDANDPGSLSADSVQALLEDSQGNLWVGTGAAGLNVLPKGEDQFRRYQLDASNPQSLSGNNVLSLFEDRWGRVWVGTNDGGLNRYDPQMDGFHRYTPEEGDPTSLGSQTVQSLYQDRSGILWVGTFGDGVNKYDPARHRFVTIRQRDDDPSSISSSMIWAFWEDADGTLWVATIAGGLNRTDGDLDNFTHYQHDPNDATSLASDQIWSLHRDRKGRLWVGTLLGLDQLDESTGEFIHYPGPSVFIMLEDEDGRLWQATGGSGLGLFDPETGQTTYWQYSATDPYSISDDFLTTLYEDSQGRLWIGTFSNGLNLFDREHEQFIRYQNDPEDITTLGHNTVLDIHEDGTGRLWIATAGGLDRFDPDSGVFDHYTEKDGLPNELIYALLEDDDSNLWLSHNRGLSRLDPRTGTFRNYDPGDGLQSNEFNQGAALRLADGRMLFGGINGFNSFYPDQVQDNPVVPPVVLTSFNLFNEPVPITDDSPLPRAISLIDALSLSYADDFFSFEFAALDYSNPEENQYTYMMEGLDKDWNFVGNRNFAGYTNVPPGSYTLKVNAANADGVWNEAGIALPITITPPFWATWWFRSLVVLLFIGAVVGGVSWRIRAIEAQRRRLEILVAERTEQLTETMLELQRSKEAAEAANRAKSVFLANMSHELRTPLNAILGFAQLMNRAENLSPEQQDNLSTINRSGEHLLGLINDVLDMSKIEAGTTVLNAQDFDLHHLLHGLEEMFQLRATQKGLDLTFALHRSLPQYVRMDEGKLRQVLMNLLGNAVKFTERGDITLRAVAKERTVTADGRELFQLQFEIEDTGPGIAPDELEDVFAPFIQTRTGHLSQEGTGLGLPISRQYARLMGGDVSLRSQLGQGSVFTFIAMAERITAADVWRGRPQRRVVGVEPGQPVYRLLVVDDKDVNRQLLLKMLVPLGFTVQEARDGNEAIEIWERWQPHLIFMDMRMPVMDGYEATRNIKATTRGQATVIIALTASALEEDREIILSEGCDDYMRKPFQEYELYDALTRHLGVRLVYEEIAEASQDWRTDGILVEGSDAARLSAEILALPSTWRQALQEATVRADLTRMLTIIEEARDVNPDLADTLSRWARDFDYNQILALLAAGDTA